MCNLCLQIAFPLFINLQIIPVADVAQLVEGGPMHQKVAGSVPMGGLISGCRLNLQWEGCRRQPIDVSLTWIFLTLSFPLPQ